MDPYTTSRDSIQPTFFSRLVNTVQNQWQIQLDRLVPFVVVRWILFAIMFVLFGVRIYFVEGFYIVTYALGIYLLHLFINFLAPRQDPDAEGPLLPNYDHDEYKPFVRKLPEYKFWYSGFRALVISFFLTLFSMFDLPVFWPILVIYFCVLFFITMKRQVKHMMKWKYLPFSFGKPKFRGNDPKKSGGIAFRGGGGGGPTSGPRAPGQGLMANGPSRLKNTGPKRVNPSGFMGNVARSSMRSSGAHHGISQSSASSTHTPSSSAGGMQKTNGIGVSAGTSRPGIGASMVNNIPTMSGMLGGGGGSGLSTTRPTNTHRSGVGTSGVGVSGM